MTTLQMLEHHFSKPNGSRTGGFFTCKDNTTLSIQAGEFSYCEPRDNIGPWTAVELGFPSRKIEGIMKYAESPNIPTETVYGWVPIIELAEVLDKECGGLLAIRSNQAEISSPQES